uniref:Uncharacterized protein n=1 Tax=Arundo donax TaxID=35708 RepID=A0A0A8XUA0_ARUDO
MFKIMSFQVQWNRYVKVDMKFDEYGVVYPDIPKQPLGTYECNIEWGHYVEAQYKLLIHISIICSGYCYHSLLLQYILT